MHDNINEVEHIYKRRIQNFLNNKQHLVFVLNSRHNLTQETIDKLHEAMADKNMFYSVVIFLGSYA
jgi:hypothetical protein